MKRFRWASPALASVLVCVLVCALAVGIDARPRYGGIVRAEIRATIATLDPTVWSGEPEEMAEKAVLVPLVFETLVGLDGTGEIRPLLAESWRSDRGGARWQFRLRPGARLHDGSVVESLQVATRLKEANPGWHLTASLDTIEIEPDHPTPDLLWDLVRPELAIGVPGPDGVRVGSGPFRVEAIEPDRRIVLRAHADHWNGRPFLDGIDVRMGRAWRDRIVDLELGRADLVAVNPQDRARLADGGFRVVATRASDLVAIVPGEGRRVADVAAAMRVLAMAADTEAVRNVIAQGQGEVASALLPGWLRGYAAAPEPRHDRSGARAAAARLARPQSAWSLQHDASDPLAQAIAERVVADARDAGLAVRLEPWRRGPRPGADFRLVRVRVEATSADRALARLVADLGLEAAVAADPSFMSPAPGLPLEAIAAAEKTLVDQGAVVPLIHLPVSYAMTARLDAWLGPVVSALGRVNLGAAWLRPETP